MRVIVPLAGPEGDVEKELKDFKNLIEVYNRPLIKYIADSRPYSLSRAVFILWEDTNKKYKISDRLKKSLGDSIGIFILDYLTEGAACSVAEYLKKSGTDEDILIDLADQYLTLDNTFTDFIERNKSKVKGIVPTFKSRYWKWSYIKLDSEGFINDVQEKINPPISDDATAGVYYFSSAGDYIAAANQMVRLNKRVKFNNRFFVSCVYNELPPKSAINFPTQIICPLGSIDGIGLFSQIAW